MSRGTRPSGVINRVTHREVAFSTRWFEIVAKHVAGEAEPYYTLSTADCVVVLPVTDAGRVLLVRQFRPVLEARTTELPSGHVETGESPAAAAHRELLEETGYHAGRMELLGSMRLDTGRIDSRLWCFFAAELSDSGRGPAGSEGIELETCPAGELVDLLLDERLCGAFHYPAVLLAHVKGHLALDAVRSVGSEASRRG